MVVVAEGCGIAPSDMVVTDKEKKGLRIGDTGEDVFDGQGEEGVEDQENAIGKECLK